MAYKPFHADAPDLESLLRDLGQRKELFSLRHIPPGSSLHASPALPGMDPHAPLILLGMNLHTPLTLPGMSPHAPQIFVATVFNPSTPLQRIMLMWQTGTGKTIGVIRISQGFIRSFRADLSLEPSMRPTVFVIGFTKSLIMADMLKHPELGFVSYTDVETLHRLRAAAEVAGPASNEMRQLSGFIGVLRRKITDRTRGGYYQFYGYKEFVNRLFNLGAVRPAEVASYLKDSASLRRAIDEKNVTVNQSLLESTYHGLLICDELHRTGNVQSSNNYGVAIQYVLDQPNAPRAVFMDATPATGSATEIVDVLNKLVPLSELPGGVHLEREDFFKVVSVGGDRTVSELLPGALERIERLAMGRVSFLLDNDSAAYPERVFAGTASYPSIPYLLFTPCIASTFQEASIAAVEGNAPHTLHDITFPRPQAMQPQATDNEESADIMAALEPALDMKNDATLDTKTGSASDTKNGAAPDVKEVTAAGDAGDGDIIEQIAAAPESWRESVGVTVLRGSEAGAAQGTSVLSGLFLAAPNLAKYSAKYAKLVEMVVDFIRSAPGKGVIFHPRVRLTGVLLIQEILRMNNILDDVSNPTDATLCAVCGAPRGGHGATKDAKTAPHAYTPARFLMAHSDIEHSTMERNLAKFNAPSNADGYQFRLLVGSKLISESYTLFAGQRMWICACPSDISTLLQVFGRVVRRFSHRGLPPEQQKVIIYILVTILESEKADPTKTLELERYGSKMLEYLVIQQVVRAFARGAVDAFANYGRIANLVKTASIDSLPYAPLVSLESLRGPPSVATFEAYGYGETEVRHITRLCRRLFAEQAVWTYEDLWAAIRGGAVESAYDPQLFTEGNYQLALLELLRPGTNEVPITYADPFYICGSAELNSTGGAVSPAQPISVRVADYLNTLQRDDLPPPVLEKLIAYAAEPEMSLLEVGSAAHIELCKRLIAGTPVALPPEVQTAYHAMYKRFRLIIATSSKQWGYVTRRSVNVLTATGWTEAAPTSLGIGRRNKENDVIVGYVTDVGTGAKFKIRPPIVARTTRRDARTIDRGAVCETAPRDVLIRLSAALAKRRGVNAAKSSSDVKTTATAYVKKPDAKPVTEKKTAKKTKTKKNEKTTANPVTASSLCVTIKRSLLALEADVRSTPAGLLDGVRWLYLYGDVPPVLV